MTSSVDPLLANAIIGQQLCRPAGHLPKHGDRFNLASAFQGKYPDFLDTKKLSGSEKKAMAMAYKIALGAKVGKPHKWNEKQQLHHRWITNFCGSFYSIQMTPIRVLQIQILSKLISPELRKACGRNRAQVLSNGKMDISYLSDVFLQIFNELHRSFAMLEQALTEDAKGEATWREKAKLHFGDALVLLENCMTSCRDAKIDSKLFAQSVQDLKMLIAALNDPDNLFPMLLIPLGTYHCNPTASLQALAEMKKQCGIFAQAIDSFYDAMKNSDGYEEYGRVAKKLGAPQKRELKLNYEKVLSCIRKMCDEMKEAALQLEKSPAISRAIAQPAALDATQVAKIQQLFQKCCQDLVEYRSKYGKSLDKMTMPITIWKHVSSGITGLADAEIPLATNFANLFNLFIRYSTHLIVSCSYNDLDSRLSYYKTMNLLQQSLTKLTKGNEEPLSQWACNADLLFLRIYQNINALDAMSQRPHFQNHIFALYVLATNLWNFLEEMHVEIIKKPDVRIVSQNGDSVISLLGNFLLQFKVMKENFPDCCKSEHFLQLEQLILEMLPWFQGSIENQEIALETVIYTLFLKAGDNPAFAPKLFSSSIAVSQFYNKQWTELLIGFDEQLAKANGFQYEGYVRLESFIQDLKEKLAEWQATVDRMPPQPTQEEIIQYVKGFLIWQQAVDGIDQQGLDQIWALLKNEADELPPQEKESILRWIHDTKEQIEGTQIAFQSAMRSINRPIFQWGAALCLQEDEPVARPKPEKKEPVEESKGTQPDAPVLSLPPIRRHETGPYLFDEIQSAIEATLLHLQPNAQTANMRTMMGILREQFYSTDSLDLPFSHAQMLFFHTAMFVEQSLKYLLSQQGNLSPGRALQLQSSHSISELLGALETPLSANATAALSSFENFYLGGRYLSAVYGKEAATLRTLSRNPTEKEARVLLDQVEARVVEVLKLIQKTLSKKPLPRLEEQQPLKLKASPLREEMIPLIENSAELHRQISTLRSHLHRQQMLFSPLCFGNTIGNNQHTTQRREKISRAFENASDYLTSINELLPAACNLQSCYGRSNALLLNSSLLLEQTIFSLMSYLDIPSESNAHMHALFEPVMHGAQSRPRTHDHNVEHLLSVVVNHIRQTPNMPALNLSQAEREAIEDVKHFIGGASRYLADAKGIVADHLKELQRLSELNYALEIDFLQPVDEADLKRKFGGGSRAQWKKDVANAICDIQSKSIYPKVGHLLSVVQKLMQYNNDLRQGARIRVDQDDEKS